AKRRVGNGRNKSSGYLADRQPRQLAVAGDIAEVFTATGTRRLLQSHNPDNSAYHRPRSATVPPRHTQLPPRGSRDTGTCPAAADCGYLSADHLSPVSTAGL